MQNYRGSFASEYYIRFALLLQRKETKGQPTTKNNDIKTTLKTLFKRQVMVSPLAVPKIVCSLFTSHNFDRYANSHSLHPPQAAVVSLAPSLSAKADRDDKNCSIFIFCEAHSEL